MITRRGGHQGPVKHLTVFPFNEKPLRTTRRVWKGLALFLGVACILAVLPCVLLAQAPPPGGPPGGGPGGPPPSGPGGPGGPPGGGPGGPPPSSPGGPANLDAGTPPAPGGAEAAPGAPSGKSSSSTGQPSGGSSEEAEVLVTIKEGWRQKGASRIYDAVDGRMITNDVKVRPFNLKKEAALKMFDDGTHGDEVPFDGVPSRVLVNSTDFIGPRTAANYDELKGLLFTIGDHPEGAQKFFGYPMVSLEWDGDNIPYDPEARTSPGVYRLTALEKRMYAFIMRDSLEITRAYQNAEGKDLVPMNDSVDEPTGLKSNSLESRRESKGIQSWESALSEGKKVKLERKMLAALAGTEIASASWFPGGISAIKIAGYRSGAAGSLSSLGLGGLGLQGGSPVYGGYGGMGRGGYGGGYGGLGAMGMGAGGGYGGMNVTSFTPAMGAMGFGAGF